MLRPKYLILFVIVLIFMACHNGTNKDDIELETEIRFSEIKHPYTTISPTIISLRNLYNKNFTIPDSYQ